MGHDSDSPRARARWGGRVAIDSVDDMERLFHGIDRQGVHLDDDQRHGRDAAGALQAVGEAHGTPASALSGTIQNDVLRNTWRAARHLSAGPSMRLITDTFEYCSQVVPKWNPISISGYHIREAGSTAAQEIAFTLATASPTWTRGETRAGCRFLRGRLSFFFNVHNNFMERWPKFQVRPAGSGPRTMKDDSRPHSYLTADY